MIFSGGCHCGAVRFEVDVPEEIEVEDCNCSICRMSGFLHLIVPKSAFTLITDESALSLYTFNTGVAKHYFCRTCGIKPFYIPRSNPDGMDVNVRCLDAPPRNMRIVPFDGKNWEANVHTLTHKSEPVDLMRTIEPQVEVTDFYFHCLTPTCFLQRSFLKFFDICKKHSISDVAI